MDIQSNVSLKNFSSMRLGGDARYLVQINSINQLTEALTWAEQHILDTITIGAGSNIVWRDSGFGGLVIVNRIRQWQVQEIGGSNTALFTMGAGENWDDSVRKTVEIGYSGLENLSLIPGTVGASPNAIELSKSRRCRVGWRQVGRNTIADRRTTAAIARKTTRISTAFARRN